MVKKISQFFSIPWYPIAISAYPVLALLSTNLGQVNAEVGVRPMAASMLLGGLVYFILWLVFRKAHQAAFLTALWLGLFFSYGHAYMAINDAYPEANYLLWLEIGCGVLFALALFWATRPQLNFDSAASVINTISAALVIMAVWQIAWKVEPPSARALGADHAPVASDLRAPANPPDVYYFLLDSYTRADTLLAAYHFDNSEFLNALKQRGFYIGECSQSNYPRTDVSVGSTLNMAYLQTLDSKFIPDNIDRGRLWDALKHSAVRYNFERMGYKTVSFATGFAWNELEDANYYISPPPISSGMTEFEGLYLDTTLARHIKDWGWIDPDAVLGQEFRDRFNNIFDNVDRVAKMPEPTFAYIHVISPHPPFVFDPNGNPTYPADFWNKQKLYPANLYQKGYTNQLQYLNKKMLAAIDTILADSKTPPIIIIQGDHGPWLQPKSRLVTILNAYYLPGHNDKLYNTITPVNSFRLVFDTYFGGKYELLKDVSYDSAIPKVFTFTEIPNSCK